MLCLVGGFLLFLIYAALIFKKIRQFFDTVDKEAKKIMADIDGMRDSVKHGGVALAMLLVHALSFFKKNHKKSKEK